MSFLKNHSGKLLALFVILFISTISYSLYHAPVKGVENSFIYLLKEYGYIILFAWSILEGEAGLIMAGLLCHTGDMNLFWAIFIAGLGGFAGDQIYFYTGRYNKEYIHKKFNNHRRKFALAHLLLQKYGWGIIFAQRYMYGMRTIIPISIGLTKYSALKFAFINLISAWVWASLTILPTWYFGDEILKLFGYLKEHFYVAIIFAVMLISTVSYYMHKISKKEPQISAE